MRYCLKSKKKKQKRKKEKNSKVLKTKNGRTMLSSKCTIYRSKESGLMKEQEAKGILSSLNLQTSLSKIPLFGDILF